MENEVNLLAARILSAVVNDQGVSEGEGPQPLVVGSALTTLARELHSRMNPPSILANKTVGGDEGQVVAWRMQIAHGLENGEYIDWRTQVSAYEPSHDAPTIRNIQELIVKQQEPS